MNNDYAANFTAGSHRLELEGRERLTITGEGLHIGQLSLEGGELHVDGRVDAIAYEEADQSRGGLLRRLFG